MTGKQQTFMWLGICVVTGTAVGVAQGALVVALGWEASSRTFATLLGVVLTVMVGKLVVR